MKSPQRSTSLRRNLLAGILIPILLFVMVDTISLYRQTLQAVNNAYDRTLLASAKAIGELLTVEGEGRQAVFTANIPYSALESFETDSGTQMTYRVSTPGGELIAGADDLPAWRGTLPNRSPYAMLVDFYDAQYKGEDVRIAVLLQPVSSGHGKGVATVQVAETLHLRRGAARQVLWGTLLRQFILIAVITVVVFIVVQRVTRPVRRLSNHLVTRHEEDLTPIDGNGLPSEIRPLVDSTNQFMQRLQHMVDHQKRFVRDAAHQLRTPLAVLKVQVQSAQRGDMSTEVALEEIGLTVNRAAVLANQMLSLAKVEQLRQQREFSSIDFADVVRNISLDLAPLLADKNIDFELSADSCIVSGHDWMLRELVKNILQNAIQHTQTGKSISVSLMSLEGYANLHINDSGPGISEELRNRLFQPFAAGSSRSGSGLGLTIAQDIAMALSGRIHVANRMQGKEVLGLDVLIHIPLAGTSI